mmetsp:Transcript_63350/g.131774  ORF Transcript_63350/g.131774 Transcript_63350/m.131774 type:complete len:124 (+) Transcript_63350:1356-1727(+)
MFFSLLMLWLTQDEFVRNSFVCSCRDSVAIKLAFLHWDSARGHGAVERLQTALDVVSSTKLMVSDILGRRDSHTILRCVVFLIRCRAGATNTATDGVDWHCTGATRVKGAKEVKDEGGGGLPC